MIQRVDRRRVPWLHGLIISPNSLAEEPRAESHGCEGAEQVAGDEAMKYGRRGREG